MFLEVPILGTIIWWNCTTRDLKWTQQRPHFLRKQKQTSLPVSSILTPSKPFYRALVECVFINCVSVWYRKALQRIVRGAEKILHSIHDLFLSHGRNSEHHELLELRHQSRTTRLLHSFLL
ncbi:hypothetical protein AMECASPLE_023887 [Ameca splendens]|uniref:Alkylated DNA repair protein AlkB homologue 8 N-terminal domain-containing protein n=1 Tax=Ameca splendens TaxID=208324 RepID=A0ABV0Y495_9TELE